MNWFWLLFLAATAVWGAERPESILLKADGIRNPEASFVMKVSVTSSQEDAEHVFEVSTKGADKTLIKTLAPKRDAGRDLLMVGQSMWAYIPNLHRSMRVSLSQKLTGEAANGDISRMRWTGDYDAVVEGEDAESWTLLLTARKTGLTYEKVRAHIAKKTYRPLHAEYLTRAGKLLKTAYFSDYRLLAGKQRPSLIRIQDAIRQDKESKIHIQSMEVKALEDTLFMEARFSSR